MTRTCRAQGAILNTDGSHNLSRNTIPIRNDHGRVHAIHERKLPSAMLFLCRMARLQQGDGTFDKLLRHVIRHAIEFLNEHVFQIFTDLNAFGKSFVPLHVQAVNESTHPLAFQPRELRELLGLSKSNLSLKKGGARSRFEFPHLTQ